MFSLRPILALAVSMAVLAVISPTHAQLVINSGNPTCLNAAEPSEPNCAFGAVAFEYEVTDVTTSSPTKCPGGVCTREIFNAGLNATFKFSWVVDSNGKVDVVDLTSLPARFSLAAVIGEGKTKSSLYCPAGSTQNDVTAPGTGNKNVTPTKVTLCWAPANPCKLTPSELNAACNAFDPGNTKKNYLQAHLVKPQQPINICSCESLNPDFVLAFCDPAVPGSCPPGQAGDPLTGVESQTSGTTGNSTCRRVVIGGTALYIGDTCF